MNVNPKWIIEQDSLVIRKAIFHKDIAKVEKDVIGGGWFYYDSKDNSFLLYSKSEDFGSVTKEQILDCIAKNKVGRFLNDDRYMNHTIKFSKKEWLSEARLDYEVLHVHKV